jgi:hypothetical protein
MYVFRAQLIKVERPYVNKSCLFRDWNITFVATATDDLPGHTQGFDLRFTSLTESESKDPDLMKGSGSRFISRERSYGRIMSIKSTKGFTLQQTLQTSWRAFQMTMTLFQIVIPHTRANLRNINPQQAIMCNGPMMYNYVQYSPGEHEEEANEKPVEEFHEINRTLDSQS